MKTWGLSRWGPLLAVLTLLVSAGALIAPGAQAAGKTVWGLVTDCSAGNPVTGATVSLVDAQAQRPDLPPTSVGGGVYTFSNPPPAYRPETGGSTPRLSTLSPRRSKGRS